MLCYRYKQIFQLITTAIEAYPISEEIVNSLNYSPHELLKQLHANLTLETRNFKLEKIHSTLESISLSEDHFDIIYFDAFAPVKTTVDVGAANDRKGLQCINFRWFVRNLLCQRSA